jgi:hypothetical protein
MGFCFSSYSDAHNVTPGSAERPHHGFCFHRSQMLTMSRLARLRSTHRHRGHVCPGRDHVQARPRHELRRVLELRFPHMCVLVSRVVAFRILFWPHRCRILMRKGRTIVLQHVLVTIMISFIVSTSSGAHACTSRTYTKNPIQGRPNASPPRNCNRS